MNRNKRAICAVALWVALAPSVFSTANAQTSAAWQATLEKARGQTLVMSNQGNKAFDTVIDAFSKKFGIKVQATVARPSTALARIKTEQNNGQYVWDIWWAITSNMVNVAVPAGMLARFDEYLMLPEVREPSNWRGAAYMYGDPTRQVFTYSHELNVGAIRNKDLYPEVKGDAIAALMDPKLKGRIAVRDASQPNAGAFTLSPILHAKGPDFLRRFLTEQQPRIFANPQQLDTAIMRGGAAVALGMQFSSLSDCRKAGGCKNLDELGDIAFVLSRGLAVFKNAPHPEATRVFINWLLSKEGQEVYVREWAKFNDSGAVSLRRDVPPHPDHAGDLPDFSKGDRYVWTATAQGSKQIDEVVKIFKQVMEK